MAYKIIYDSFWTDPKIKKLETKTKLLFLYLITNPHSHYSGIFYLPEVYIEEETGLSKKEIRYGIDTLSEGYLIRIDRIFQVIWVVNMLKYQAKGAKQLKGIASHLTNLHNCPLIQDFLEYYKDLNIPFRYRIDTVSEGYQEGILQNTEYRIQNTEEETVTENIFSENSVEFSLAKLLYDLIKERHPKFKKPNLQKWASFVDKMIRIDKRAPAEIETVIRWCQGDDFWQNNILSTSKLRKQYDQLFLKMPKNTQGENQGSLPKYLTEEDLEAMYR